MGHLHVIVKDSEQRKAKALEDLVHQLNKTVWLLCVCVCVAYSVFELSLLLFTLYLGGTNFPGVRRSSAAIRKRLAFIYINRARY